MANAVAEPLSLHVKDVSDQKEAYLHDVPSDQTVGDLIQELLPELRLRDLDSTGRPLVWTARLEREGRHLHVSELLGDAVQSGDEIVLQPNVEAGGRSFLVETHEALEV